jgi:uncharacterized protein YggE
MKHLIIGLLLIFSLSVFSQSGEKNFIDQNYIEVTGKAELDIVPDLIYLKIVLSDKDNKSKQSLDEIEKSMISKLTEIGVDINKDLSIKDFASNFKNYWISKSDIVLTKEYQLIVHETKTLQKVFFELQNLGISNLTIDKLDHSKIEKFREDVKNNAIKAAKNKAESLTSTINQTIGKAIYIQELDNQYLTNALSGRVANIRVGVYSLKNKDESMPDVEFEKINLQYSILVRFELK